MLRFLWQASPFIIILVFITGICSGLGSAVLIALINSKLSNTYQFPEFLWVFSGLCAIILLTGSLSHYLTNRLSQKTIFDLRLQISRLILSAPYSHLLKIGKPGLLANLTEDITSIANAAVFIPIIFINIAIIIGCMGYLSWLSWQLALILSAIILFGIISHFLLKTFPKKAMQRARNEYDTLNANFRSLTEGVKELKLHHGRSEAFMKYSLSLSAENYRRHTLSGLTAYMLAGQWANLLYYIAIGLILFAFPDWPEVNQEIINGYTLVLLFMMSPLSILTNSLAIFGRAKVALKKVHQLGKSLNKKHLPPHSRQQPDNWSEFKSLNINSITHSYHREKENQSFILGPINIEFKPGELVFLIGGNGSGKTTLAMLICGLFIPESGNIYFNGDLVNKFNRDAYLQNFSVVFSDFHLFDQLFGFDAEDIDIQVNDYLKRLHLNHKVAFDNGKFSSLDLSQGQKKRLALLVTYLEDRPLYIFDEWAADQDPEFKHFFYTELLPSLTAKGKTVLAITHDERYFDCADRCIRMEEGHLIQTNKGVSNK